MEVEARLAVVKWGGGMMEAVHCKTNESHSPHKFTKKESGLMTNVISPNSIKKEFCNPLTFVQIHLSCAFVLYQGEI